MKSRSFYFTLLLITLLTCDVAFCAQRAGSSGPSPENMSLLYTFYNYAQKASQVAGAVAPVLLYPWQKDARFDGPRKLAAAGVLLWRLGSMEEEHEKTRQWVEQQHKETRQFVGTQLSQEREESKKEHTRTREDLGATKTELSDAITTAKTDLTHTLETRIAQESEHRDKQALEESQHRDGQDALLREEIGLCAKSEQLRGITTSLRAIETTSGKIEEETAFITSQLSLLRTRTATRDDLTEAEQRIIAEQQKIAATHQAGLTDIKKYLQVLTLTHALNPQRATPEAARNFMEAGRRASAYYKSLSATPPAYDSSALSSSSTEARASSSSTESSSSSSDTALLKTPETLHAAPAEDSAPPTS